MDHVPLFPSSHADAVRVRHAFLSHEHVGEEGTRDEPQERLRGRLLFPQTPQYGYPYYYVLASSVQTGKAQAQSILLQQIKQKAYPQSMNMNFFAFFCLCFACQNIFAEEVMDIVSQTSTPFSGGKLVYTHCIVMMFSVHKVNLSLHEGRKKR